MPAIFRTGNFESSEQETLDNRTIGYQFATLNGTGHDLPKKIENSSCLHCEMGQVHSTERHWSRVWGSYPLLIVVFKDGHNVINLG